MRAGREQFPPLANLVQREIPVRKHGASIEYQVVRGDNKCGFDVSMTINTLTNVKDAIMHVRSGLIYLVFVGFVAFSSSACQLETSRADEGGGEPIEITIDGVVSPEDRYAYLMQPFDVPDNVERIEVEFEYDRSNGSELEIGLYDPDRFRGTSRFSKSDFFIATHTATPSYYPGVIPAGTWNVSIGVPTAYEETPFSIDIRMYLKNEVGGTGSGPWTEVIKTGSDWYLGDLHSHTGHSDGYGCRNRHGERAPCQVHQNVEAAHDRGLDFVAITDHNTTSHHNEMVALQQYFDDMLLLRGQEITTFYGHTNILGTSQPIDFTIPKNELFASISENARKVNGLVSLNHPGRETGDACTGCGWSMPNTGYSGVDAIEIINGSDIESSTAGMWFWYDRLNEGYRITAIGGSDDHGASMGSRQIGTPTTGIYAAELSEKALLDGIRKGHVFIKTRGPDGPSVVLSASDSEGMEYMMGDELTATPGDEVQLNMDVTQGAGYSLVVVKNGDPIDLLDMPRVRNDDARFEISVSAGEGRDWYLVQLRDEEGIAVFTNPIYIAV